MDELPSRAESGRGATTMTSAEVAEALGISPATLYAYVSRGLIRSLPAEGDKRGRRYLAADVQALLAKKAARTGDETDAADALAATALHWGTPLLNSSITLIADGRLYYRGYDAAELAAHSHFEGVVTLLWTGQMAAHPPKVATQTAPGVLSPSTALPDLARMSAALALAAPADLDAYDLSPAGVIRTGWRILALLGRVALGDAPAQGGMLAECLVAAWCGQAMKADRVAIGALLDRALILCADHELNASSFAARVVASAGATPYAAVSAGLAALGGTRHGGMTERAGALLRELDMAGDARALVAERLRRGEGVPGFGHVLYPDGDPRAVALLDALAQTLPDAPALPKIADLLRVMAARDHHPTLDLALAALMRALGQPEARGLTLFALGRAAGWIAHALEQYADGRLLRPRARYLGPEPRPD
jgi:citrate synthase